MIRSLLIANRGEIACRIIRTARRMGIATVAVYSDADRSAPHVRQADAAVRIGGQAPADSYLRIDAIMEAVRKTGADSVHPGYGFLSENADFAAECVKAGLVFVGPSADSIRAMGDKARAKAIMRAAGVPVVPGYDGDEQDDEHLTAEARAIGFPLLIKAKAGGGGRGMRRVSDPGEFASALESARREAGSAFGCGDVLLERLVTDARHIEIQIFADGHGNVVHLGERDCSAQRRHQKIIEEAPSPFVDDTMREAMGKVAVEAARAVDYVGAGTVEFIVAPDRTFHFLEMNTRLQVEHPVTEAITGLDLVEWQLRVASGERLPLTQDEIRFSGHAIEARLCAEDPRAGFAPQTGKVLYWRPDAAVGARIDHGLSEGGEVTPFYDPMVAKVIAHGASREEATARLRVGIRAAPVLGVVTNRTFLLDLLGSEIFSQAKITTDLIDGWSADGTLLQASKADAEDFALAAAFLALADGDDWFSSTGRARCPMTLECEGATRSCAVLFERGRLASILVDDETIALERFEHEALHARYSFGGVVGSAIMYRDGRELWVDRDGRTLKFVEPDPLQASRLADDGRLVVSPVAGMLRTLAVVEGDAVAAGDLVAVVEAMKMETSLRSRVAGVVTAVYGKAGEQMRAGATVAEIEPH